jgi:hypothetical protein
LLSDRFQSRVEGDVTEVAADSATRPGSGERKRLYSVASGIRGTLLQSRAVVGLLLVVAGLVWAILRGLPFYGFSPTHLAYDLDQPPWLLLLVSGWLWYRSRRR